MRPWIEEKFANPQSPSTWGREAAAAIEVARDRIDRYRPDEGRFAFTSGATEALNWAIKGTLERLEPAAQAVTIATEHAAVLDTAEWLEGQGIRGRAPACWRRRPGRPRQRLGGHRRAHRVGRGNAGQ